MSCLANFSTQTLLFLLKSNFKQYLQNKDKIKYYIHLKIISALKETFSSFTTCQKFQVNVSYKSFDNRQQEKLPHIGGKHNVTACPEIRLIVSIELKKTFILWLKINLIVLFIIYNHIFINKSHHDIVFWTSIYINSIMLKTFFLQ